MKDWYIQSLTDIYDTLSTTQQGLTQEEVEKRKEIFGCNQLPTPQKISPMKRLLMQCHNPLIYLLLGAAVTTSLLNHWVDTLVIVGVVFINALIGAIQEGKAEKAISALQDMLALRARAMRNGHRITIDSKDLVPGDLILLEAGDKVPADVRLIETHHLWIQEALLTGESIPVEKNCIPVAPETPLGERFCMAYSGTLITQGQGKGIVVSTGTQTEIGRINQMLIHVTSLTTPLIQKMSVLGRWITICVLFVAVSLFIFGSVVRDIPLFDLFMAVVGFSVGAIPEGLPAVLTITLAVGVKAMARRHAIVRRLPIIETIGSVSVICTDKTGTLTCQEMMVERVITQDNMFQVEGVGYAPQGQVLPQVSEKLSDQQHLFSLSLAAALCNDAVLLHKEEEWTIEGDPMEGALLTFAYKIGLTSQLLSEQWMRQDTLPFDSKHRFMATRCQCQDGEMLTFVKGAPECVIEMCSFQKRGESEQTPLDAACWQNEADNLAHQGYRVLALASKKADRNLSLEEDINHHLVFLGLLGLIDPPRPETVEAVAQCQQAGIAVKMITGDHVGTATAIARKIGLLDPDRVMTGVELEKLSDEELEKRVLSTTVFARTNPEHKLRLVKALQAHGLTVAMTGDGVNDAPALKRADVGIAMGVKGSEAAKEASSIVLTDDNFASIVAAIREGRIVSDNIKKSLIWALPTNAGEGLIILWALLWGMTLPITPLQILWVNMVSATTLGMALAFEGAQDHLMTRPPVSRHAPFLEGGVMWHILFVSCLFLAGVLCVYSYAISHNYPLDLARTLSLNSLVAMEVFHLFFVRYIYNPSLSWKAFKGTKVMWVTVLVVILAQLSLTYFPPLQKLFATQPLSLWDGVLVLSTGVALFFVVELEKQIRLRLESYLVRFKRTKE